MKSEDPHRQIQYLASVLALVSSYYALRASLQLPKFRELFVGIEEEPKHLSLGMVILDHPHLFLALVIATMVATIFAIWSTFKHHQIIYPIGIALQFFLADRAVASAMDPIIRMISAMGQ